MVVLPGKNAHHAATQVEESTRPAAIGRVAIAA
jgi:hypothetical protein